MNDSSAALGKARGEVAAVESELGSAVEAEREEAGDKAADSQAEDATGAVWLHIVDLTAAMQ